MIMLIQHWIKLPRVCGVILTRVQCSAKVALGFTIKVTPFTC